MAAPDADDRPDAPIDAVVIAARWESVLQNSTRADLATGICTAGPHREELEVLLDGKPVEMPPKEIELLYFLASRPGKVFTREQLLEQVWGFDFFGDSRTVDVHVKRIREKLGERDEWQLKTVWGVGYKFDVAK